MSIEINEPQRWGMFGTILWSIFIATSFVFIQVFVTAVYIGNVYGEDAVIDSARFDHYMMEVQYNGTVISLSTISTAILCSVLVLLAIKLKKGATLKDHLGFTHVDMKTSVSWLIVIAVFIICSDLLTISMGRPIVPDFMTSVYNSIEAVWLLWLALVIAAPLFEELFVRGFIYSGLSASVLGPVGAILITSLFWAVVHSQYDSYEIATIFFMGLILGTARWKTGSVLLTMGLHSIINLVATIETVIHVS